VSDHDIRVRFCTRLMCGDGVGASGAGIGLRLRCLKVGGGCWRLCHLAKVSLQKLQVFQEILSDLSCLFDVMSWFGACSVVGGRFCNGSWCPGACMM